MEKERRCPLCGQVIPWGLVDCPECSKHRHFLWSVRRNTLLLLSFLLLIVLFIATGFLTKWFHAQEKARAEGWYSRGERELGAGQVEAALAGFRTALAYSRDNRLYRLRLAQALVAARRPEEARAYLLGLWEEEPGSGTVNLELARLAVHERSVPDALRYFHQAIYGEWGDDPARRRRAARLELATFLLEAGEKVQAQSDLVALAADLPRDGELETQVGTLLLKVSEYDLALKLFRQALSLNPHSAMALAGAGEAYFEMANYREAQRYLERAVAQDPHLAEASALAETARAVINADPFQRTLSPPEQGRRGARAFHRAWSRLGSCAAQRGVGTESAAQGNELHSLEARAEDLKPKVREHALSRDPKLLVQTMDLVFEIERTTAQSCGEPQGQDRALLLLAPAQGGTRR